jgi:hypothetical protein
MADLLGTGVLARSGEDSVACVMLEMRCLGVREASRFADPSDWRLSLREFDPSLGVGYTADVVIADFSGVPRAAPTTGSARVVFMIFFFSFDMLELLVIVAGD